MQLETPKKLPTSYSEMLQDEYGKRIFKNPKYSQRAFARDLGVSSGTLSNILNKKTGLSLKKAESIASKLSLKIEDQELFLKLVEMSSATPEKNLQLDSQLYNSDSSYLKLNDDYYSILTEWYYFAIVELVKVCDFENNDEWIAQRIGLPTNEIRPIINRLIRVELLQEIDGQLVQTYDYFVSPSGTPLDAAKKFHKQILNKAIEAVDNQEIGKRNFTSGFLRVRKSDMPHITKRIKEFRRELSKEIESGEGHDSVYAFSIQFFRGDQASE